MKPIHRLFLGTALLAMAFGAKAGSMAVTLRAPAAKTVFVAGSFDVYWQKRYPLQRDAHGRWVAVLDLPPGRYEYQFLVDGHWQYDPAQPSVEDSFGRRNNVLIISPAGM